ncbi:hypothetical protein ONZ45_g4429 [Pleurotus djamor]|nr:hypothetical protein ONZ45_g4429 [Pleurotus djamor]
MSAPFAYSHLDQQDSGSCLDGSPLDSVDPSLQTDWTSWINLDAYGGTLSQDAIVNAAPALPTVNNNFDNNLPLYAISDISDNTSASHATPSLTTAPQYQASGQRVPLSPRLPPGIHSAHSPFLSSSVSQSTAAMPSVAERPSSARLIASSYVPISDASYTDHEDAIDGESECSTNTGRSSTVRKTTKRAQRTRKTRSSLTAQAKDQLLAAPTSSGYKHGVVESHSAQSKISETQRNPDPQAIQPVVNVTAEVGMPEPISSSQDGTRPRAHRLPPMPASSLAAAYPTGTVKSYSDQYEISETERVPDPPAIAPTMKKVPRSEFPNAFGKRASAPRARAHVPPVPHMNAATSASSYHNQVPILEPEPIHVCACGGVLYTLDHCQRHYVTECRFGPRLPEAYFA